MCGVQKRIYSVLSRALILESNRFDISNRTLFEWSFCDLYYNVVRCAIYAVFKHDVRVNIFSIAWYCIIIIDMNHFDTSNPHTIRIVFLLTSTMIYSDLRPRG